MGRVGRNPRTRWGQGERTGKDLNPFCLQAGPTGEGLQWIFQKSPLSLVEFDLGGFLAVCVTDIVLTGRLPGEYIWELSVKFIKVIAGGIVLSYVH